MNLKHPQEFMGEEPTQAPERPAATTHTPPGKIAVIVSDGFEQREFDGPVDALRAAGFSVDVFAPDEARMAHIQGVNHLELAAGTKPNRLIRDARVEDYIALVVPGGLGSPDEMRQSQRHLALVQDFMEANKPLAVICHGPWLLADADLVQGRTLTSWPGIRRDMERAGANWVDQDVVVDGNLITSRKPDDVPAFARALIAKLGVTAS